MYSDGMQLEIKSRLKWELVLKSTTATPVIAVLALSVAYFQFGVTRYSNTVTVLMILCALNAGVRYFIGLRGIQHKIEKHRTARFVFFSLALNTVLWTLTFLIVFLQTSASTLPFTIAFMVSISLMTASVLTLSYSPALAIFFQLGLLSGNVIAFVREYVLTNSGDYLFLSFGMLLLGFYCVRQTRDFYRQLFDKYRYEVELEFSLQQLTISNQRVVEETARAENSSRLAALGDISGGMAHEINTPLAIINLMIEDVLRLLDSVERSTDDVKAKLNTALSAANRISRIITSLLQISRKGQNFDLFADIKVAKLLEDVLNMCQEKFALAGISLDVAPPPDVVVRTKQVLISQVLLNILNNAFDEVIQHGDKKKYINLFFKIDDSKLTLCIENSGPKISENIQDKIFQPFFTTKEVGRGSGLGLSICKGIVESLKERIWLEKSLPKTTFCFTLPIVENSTFSVSES